MPKKEQDPAKLFPAGQYDEIQRLAQQDNPGLISFAEERLEQLTGFYGSSLEKDTDGQRRYVTGGSPLLVGMGVVFLLDGVRRGNWGEGGLGAAMIGFEGRLLSVFRKQASNPQVEILQSALANLRSLNSGEGQGA